MFQPIVENTLKHGFKYRFTKAPKIHIRAYLDNSVLHIDISDNGMGMEDAIVKELNEKMRSGIFPQNNNIGLFNINKRIQLLYGSDHGCTICSQQYTGTTLSITLPI